MTSLIMPVAGMGSRFEAAGYVIPKPMLPLDGRTFVEWAWLSADRVLDVSATVFVAREEHLSRGLDKVLSRTAPVDRSRTVLAEGPVLGAVVDAARALRFLPQDDPVAVNDCDHAFTLDAGMETFLHRDGRNGIVVVGFPSSNPAHGFGLLGRHPGELQAIVEKQVVGPMAVGGCYLFSSARLLTSLVEIAQSRPHAGELYMSHLVNIAIRQGADARMQPATSYLPFGTPAELGHLHRGQVEMLLS